MIVHEKLGRGQPLSKLWKKLVIVNSLHKHKCWSKGELLRRINMGNITFATPIQDLMEDGLVKEDRFNMNSPGRQNITYEITTKGREFLACWRELMQFVGVDY